MSDNAYGSKDLHCIRFADTNGSHVKDDTLFLNSDDYWTNFNNQDRIYFWWSSPLLSKLERHIRRKWKTCLPDINISFERIKAKGTQFNPTTFSNNNDTEEYFELLVLWKELKGKDYLTLKPRYQPYRHKKSACKTF